MFPKKNRFTFKGGLPKNVYYARCFNLKAGENNLGKLQVAVVVSKKVDLRATVRNRIKREVTEIVRKNVSSEKSFDLIFYIKKEALLSRDLENELKEAFNKIENV